MLIQKQYMKLILLETQSKLEIHKSFSLLKKRQKQFQIFQKEQLKYYDFISSKYNINIKVTQYNTFNVKLSNLQLNRLKSAIKNGTEVTLNL